jgi:hypothetical protein
VGIGKNEAGNYVLRVNVDTPEAANGQVQDYEGVPIEYVVVGTITPM